MSQCVMFDLSTASARSKGQARRRLEPPVSEDERRARRKLARKNRLLVKKEDVVDTHEPTPAMPPHSPEIATSQSHAIPVKTSHSNESKNLGFVPNKNLHARPPAFSVMTAEDKPSDRRPYGQARRRLLDRKRKHPDGSMIGPEDYAEETFKMASIRTSTAPAGEGPPDDAGNVPLPGASESDPSSGHLVSTPNQAKVHIKDWVALFRGNIEAVQVEKNQSAKSLLWTLDPCTIHHAFDSHSCYLCSEETVEAPFSIKQQTLSYTGAVLSHLSLKHQASAFQLVAVLLSGSSVSPFCSLRCWVCDHIFWDTQHFYSHYLDCLIKEARGYMSSPLPHLNLQMSHSHLDRATLRATMLWYLRCCMDQGVYARDTWHLAHRVCGALCELKEMRRIQQTVSLRGDRRRVSRLSQHRGHGVAGKAPENSPQSDCSQTTTVKGPPADTSVTEHTTWTQPTPATALIREEGNPFLVNPMYNVVRHDRR